MYSSMQQRHRYPEVVLYTGAVVLLTYLVIMGMGYYFFAQYTLAPGTYCVPYVLCVEDHFTPLSIFLYIFL
ncbi:hypothetical protein B484DRAFT_114787 [Ochromonadaceae sp. CCMP2298]|nr:hypothetical protein B484DRAFT_114787 [Ochromonadaceae sp. CCMP2298]